MPDPLIPAIRQTIARVREKLAFGDDDIHDPPPDTIEVHLFQVTGAISGAFYPATRYMPVYTADDWELADPEDVGWLFPANGEFLPKFVWFPCKLIGVHTDGVPVYAPVDTQQKFLCKLDGTLNYQGSATGSIWGHSGGASAAGTATRSGNAVASVTVTNGGTGYQWAPTVTFSGGGGTGATATATVAAGVVTGVTVTAGGSGYTSDPTVVFSADADTGMNITIYDALLSAGQSVAAGQFVTAFYCKLSRRYRNDGAQCA